MSLILNVGLAKEIHEPDGRSLGATYNIRVKLDAALRNRSHPGEQ